MRCSRARTDSGPTGGSRTTPGETPRSRWRSPTPSPIPPPRSWWSRDRAATSAPSPPTASPASTSTGSVRSNDCRRRAYRRATSSSTTSRADSASGASPPSIDTPLHAFLDARHVDHTHPDAVIALAAAAEGERLVEECYGGEVGWLDWQRPGFELGLRLRDFVGGHPAARGVVLGGHGVICWGGVERGVRGRDTRPRAARRNIPGGTRSRRSPRCRRAVVRAAPRRRAASRGHTARCRCTWYRGQDTAGRRAFQRRADDPRLPEP